MLIIRKTDCITLLYAARGRHLPAKLGQLLAILVPGQASTRARKRQNALVRARRLYHGHDPLETVSGKEPSGKFRFNSVLRAFPSTIWLVFLTIH